MNDLQGRPDGALGVFFVRGGPAEIRQDAITHVAGDKPVVARDHIAAEGSISVQQAAQLFRVEFLTQRRGAHQIAEHHGELAAFALVSARLSVGLAGGLGENRTGSSAGASSRRNAAIASSILATMAHRGDAKFLEIVGGQIGQEFGVTSFSRNDAW